MLRAQPFLACAAAAAEEVEEEQAAAEAEARRKAKGKAPAAEEEDAAVGDDDDDDDDEEEVRAVKGRSGSIVLYLHALTCLRLVPDLGRVGGCTPASERCTLPPCHLAGVWR